MTAPLASLLIVEDDPEISRLLADFMRREGFEVECADSGKAMDAVLQRIAPGFAGARPDAAGRGRASDLPAAACRREYSDFDADREERRVDRVVGLEMGADDYLTKPFAPRDCWRGSAPSSPRHGGVGKTSGPRAMRSTGSCVDLDGASIQSGDASDEALELTSAEFDLLGASCSGRPGAVARPAPRLDRGRAAEPSTAPSTC